MAIVGAFFYESKPLTFGHNFLRQSNFSRSQRSLRHFFVAVHGQHLTFWLFDLKIIKKGELLKSRLHFLSLSNERKCS